jgi:hypothetical protein
MITTKIRLMMRDKKGQIKYIYVHLDMLPK